MERKTSKHVDALLHQLNFSKNGREAIYMAVPLSSGLRLWELAAEHGLSDPAQVRRRFPAEYEMKVFRPNMEDAEMAFIHAQQRYPHCRIVNPGRVSVAGWSQEQYRSAWKAFISKFVDTVIASEEWACSRGCVDEVLHALKIRVPVVDMNKNVLSREDVSRQLERAHAKATRMGLSVSFLAKLVEPRSNKSAFERHRSTLLCK
jgi:hypothetical protein